MPNMAKTAGNMYTFSKLTVCGDAFLVDVDVDVDDVPVLVGKPVI